MEEVGIGRLPEGCISQVLSLTSPRDSCRSAAAAPLFRSAAESDAVWEAFLPGDYREILSRAVSPVEYGSKKELYFRLCEPILIDGGKKSFLLEKSTGRKCFMLSARDLSIVWSETPHYWSWVSHPESRFSEVAELVNVCWLEIRGKIHTSMLSHKTTYVAYLVYKFSPTSFGFDHPYQEVSVVAGPHSSKEPVRLQPLAEADQIYVPTPQPYRERRLAFRRVLFTHRPMRQLPGLPVGEIKQLPVGRPDGWMEIAMGEFFNDVGGEGEVDMSFVEIKGGHWKRGLIVQGIELRPKRQDVLQN